MWLRDAPVGSLFAIDPRRFSNLDMFGALELARQIEERIPFTFNVGHLKGCSVSLNVRPYPKGLHPERTRSEFCIYDDRHKDYSYTSAYRDYLVRNLTTPEQFSALTGRDPFPQPAILE